MEYANPDSADPEVVERGLNPVEAESATAALELVCSLDERVGHIQTSSIESARVRLPNGNELCADREFTEDD